MTIRTFTAVYEQHGDWWIGWVEELPGATAQARTLVETRDNPLEVIPIILAERRATGRTDATGVVQLREELTVAL